MLAIKNVLVATDFSDSSAAALNYGRAFAHACQARLHVMHVVEQFIVTDSAPFAAGMAAVPTLMQQLEESQRKALDALITDDDRRTLNAKAVFAQLDSPAQAIVDYARMKGIDLIVMGTHGRQGLSRLVMGSVAETVIRTASCPVLTVKHPEHELLAADAMTVVE